jgi:hypothetical protein
MKNPTFVKGNKIINILMEMFIRGSFVPFVFFYIGFWYFCLFVVMVTSIYSVCCICLHYCFVFHHDGLPLPHNHLYLFHTAVFVVFGSSYFSVFNICFSTVIIFLFCIRVVRSFDNNFGHEYSTMD